MQSSKSAKKKEKAIYHGAAPRAALIMQFDQQKRQHFLNSFDTVLTGCEGVLWKYGEPIPNIGLGINYLKKIGKEVRYISNESFRQDDRHLARLAKMGVTDAKGADLVHPAKTIVRYLNRNQLGLAVFSLACKEANAFLSKNGITVLTMTPDTELNMHNIIEKVRPDNKVQAVVLDLNFNITYGELTRALQYLDYENCALVVGSADTYMPLTKHMTTIGNAGFVNMLRVCSGKFPILLAQPSPLLCEELVDMFGITDRKRVLYVGGNLFNDIGFALKCGFQTLFVLSGHSTKEDMLHLQDEFKPDFMADSIADFAAFESTGVA